MTHTIETLFEYLLPDLNNLNFIQIGTNTGDDYFNKVCRRYRPKKTLLIEPHSLLNDSIKRNYNELEYQLVNVAIVDDESCQEIKMYNVNSTQHSSVIPLKDWNKEIETTVPAKTIKSLIKEYSFNHVNLLYIDTEGFDSFIINYIFKNNLQNMFDSIVFEHWGFEDKDYETVNNLHGLRGMEYIKILAQNNNFNYADFRADGDKDSDNHVIYKRI